MRRAAYRQTEDTGERDLSMDRSRAIAHVVVRISPVYGASVTIDASRGNEFVVTATNGVAFMIKDPTNPAVGQRITIRVRNASGGVLGVLAWGAAYKMAAWTSPADTFSRAIDVQYDGTNWVEVSRTPADVPN